MLAAGTSVIKGSSLSSKPLLDKAEDQSWAPDGAPFPVKIRWCVFGQHFVINQTSTLFGFQAWKILFVVVFAIYTKTN